jgi:hypothetical protein
MGPQARSRSLPPEGAARQRPGEAGSAAGSLVPLLDTSALRGAVRSTAGCAQCESLRCDGWESVSGPLGPPQLECIGTLRDPAIEEPTLTERHEAGTGYWHARAPLAVQHHPYNRCSVWRCPACGRGFVQYTEAGGYYVDHRIRAIDPDLITD